MATKSKDIPLPSIPEPILPSDLITEPTPPIDISQFPQMYSDYQQMQIEAYPAWIQAQLGIQPEVGRADINYYNQMWQGVEEHRISRLMEMDLDRELSFIAVDLARQSELMRGAFDITQGQAALANQFQLEQAQLYGPQYVDLFNQLAQETNPEFMNVYNQLAGRVSQGLEAGYDMGAELESEVQQAIRTGQAARGNYLGPAPTAQEAFGTGEAALNLYNTRLAQAQGFLAGPQPGNLWAPMGFTMPGLQLPQVQQGYYPKTGGSSVLSATTQPYTPNANWAQNIGLDPSMAQNMFLPYNEMMLQSQANFNNAQINAAQVSNAGMFNAYDASFDQFLYKQAVANGLYETPPAPNTSGAQAGAIMGGVGSAVGAVGSAAAASAAAAAFCWLARRCIPKQWRQWREFLFTKAPASFRRKYIFGARRMSETISEEDANEVGRWMTRCLKK